MENSDKITTSIYIKRDLHERLREAVGEVGISLVISKLIEKWLDGETKLEIEPVKNKAKAGAE